LVNLSKLPARVIEQTRLVLSGQGQVFEQATCGLVYGVLAVLQGLAEQCGVVRDLGSSRLAKLTLFLVLARVAHQSSRLSAWRWARDHAVSRVLGLASFDEDDLYAALNWAAEHQHAIEHTLYQHYVKHSGRTPTLVLYDVTPSYLESEHNELAAFGYNRDGKPGKQQIVIGLLTAHDGEPLSVQVFEGNTTDPQTLGSQIDALAERFEVNEVVVVGNRGMIKAKGKAKLSQAQFKYITALTNPQIRKLIKQDVIQPDLFEEQVVEIEQGDKRLILRRDPATQHKEQHRRADKIRRLSALVEERNRFVAQSKRAKPEAGLKKLQTGARRHKINAFTELSLTGRMLELHLNEAKQAGAGLLDGCYCIETDVAGNHMNSQEVHDRYKDLQKVGQNFRRLKTVVLEVRPIFVRKAQRTQEHVRSGEPPPAFTWTRPTESQAMPLSAAL
jgi:transposase